MNAKKRIALVIGSGGIKCAAAAGLWRVLREEGIVVDSVVAYSGGSMYAALIANHIDVKVMEEWSKTDQHPCGPLRNYGSAMKQKPHQLSIALLILPDPARNADRVALGVFPE